MIQCQAQCDIAASIMSQQSEALMAQAAHDRQHVLGDRTFAMCRMICGRRRTSRTSISTAVGAHDGLSGTNQNRRDSVPGRGRSRMAVQKNNRRSVAAVTHENLSARSVDERFSESFEHHISLPEFSRGGMCVKLTVLVDPLGQASPEYSCPIMHIMSTTSLRTASDESIGIGAHHSPSRCVFAR